MQIVNYRSSVIFEIRRFNFLDAISSGLSDEIIYVTLGVSHQIYYFNNYPCKSKIIYNKMDLIEMVF